MLYVITLALILMGLYYNKSKYMYLVLLVWIWLLMGWSAGNADYGIYLSRFNNYRAYAAYTEIGYTLLMRLANEAGLTYQQFLPIAMLVYVIIIGGIAWKLSPAPSFVLALYLIFPACMEATQMRYTFASAMVLLGLYFLLNNSDDKAAEIKYICCIAAASSLHASTAVFFAFVVIRRLSLKRMIWYTAVITFVVYLSGSSLIISIARRLPILSEKISRVLAAASRMYTNVNVLKTTFRCFLFFLLFMSLMYYLKKRYGQTDARVNLILIENIQKVNVASLIILPLLLYAVDFYRIQQTLTIFNYCSLSYYCVMLPMPEVRNWHKRYRHLITRRRLLFVGSCVGMAVINLYYLVLHSTNILYVFRPFFENNLLLGK